MKAVSELSVDEGIELALTILLEQGWKPNKHYESWKEYAGEEYGEDDEDFYSGSNLVDRSGAWEALMSGYTTDTATKDGITARRVADQGDGLAHDSEVYFVVLSLSDSQTKRYFKRDGWYASYDGGHLEDGTNSEVHPEERTVTVFN